MGNAVPSQVAGVPQRREMVRGSRAARRDQERDNGPGDVTSRAGGDQGDLGGRTGLDPLPPDEPPGSPQPSPTSASPPAGETEDERFARYRKDAQELYDLAGEIGVPGIGKRDVRVFETTTDLVNAVGLAVPARLQGGLRDEPRGLRQRRSPGVP